MARGWRSPGPGDGSLESGPLPQGMARGCPSAAQGMAKGCCRYGRRSAAAHPDDAIGCQRNLQTSKQQALRHQSRFRFFQQVCQLSALQLRRQVQPQTVKLMPHRLAMAFWKRSPSG